MCCGLAFKARATFARESLPLAHRLLAYAKRLRHIFQQPAFPN